MSKNTIFVLKKDTIERNLVEDILEFIKQYYYIKLIYKTELRKEQLIFLKDLEFKNNWHIYPDWEVMDNILKYEVWEVIALHCEIKSKNIDAISFWKKIKWNHHLPHLCSKDSIRWKFCDKRNTQRILTKDKISYLLDNNWEIISTVPNLIHCVDNELEYNQHFNEFFSK